MVKISNKLSLIVPCRSTSAKINDFLYKLVKSTLLPNEIILINTSLKIIKIEKNLNIFFKKKNIFLIIINKKNIFPGKARNLGIEKSSNKYLMFLDLLTTPSDINSLKINFNQITKNNLDAVIGQTFYLASTSKEKIIRASTYGIKNLVTLPGSIFHRKIIITNGFFIENIRAGEDVDWMRRLESHCFRVSNSREHIVYSGLIGITFFSIFKKWYRNYFYGASIKYYSAHKSIYFYYVFIILLFLAYNWNGLVAKWNSEDPFYIPNITKFIFFILIGSYLLIRSIVMPLRKGVNISYLFPFNFFLIFIFSLILDFIKFSAFLSARFLKKNFFNFFKFNMN